MVSLSRVGFLGRLGGIGGILAIIPIFGPIITTLVNAFGGDSAGTAIRNSTGTVKDYAGVLQTMAIDVHRAQGHRWTGSAWVADDGAGNALFPTKTIDTAVWNDTKPDYATGTVVAAGAMMNDAGKYYSTALGGTTNGATLLTDIGVTDWVEEGIYSSGFGLLVEPAGTNLMLQSEDFSTTWTAMDVTVTTNTVVAPSGATTADKIIATATTAAHYVFQGLLSSGQYTVGSCFFKDTGESYNAQIRVANLGIGLAWATFDLVNGVVAYSGGTGLVGSGIEALGSGWYRCYIALNNAGLASHGYVVMPVPNTATGERPFYLGDGVKGIYAWGFQMETGSVPTSPIKTTTAANSRATEAGNVNWPIANNFSNDAGVCITDVIFLADKANYTAQSGIVSTHAGSTSVAYIASNGNLRSNDGTNIQQNIISFVKNDVYRLAIRWNAATSKFQFGVLNVSAYSSAWVWAAEGVYDGAFTLGSLISLMVGAQYPMIFRNLPLIYDTDMTTTEIEEKF